MIAATIYNIETGLIDRTATVAEADIEANCGQGESWIEGVYSPDEYVVRDGSLVKLPQKPSHAVSLDLQRLVWVDDLYRLRVALRRQRDIELKSTDWTQLPDAPVDKESWAEYRQKLRDLPEKTDPLNVVWPDRP